mmetsp:Transcript_68918/g.149968  ORF Transcript_68918/g.149968 Transcript_68918/m.149968 type:complete len:93 (-) Transcript_68918:478-756(-)
MLASESPFTGCGTGTFAALVPPGEACIASNRRPGIDFPEAVVPPARGLSGEFVGSDFDESAEIRSFELDRKWLAVIRRLYSPAPEPSMSLSA